MGPQRAASSTAGATMTSRLWQVVEECGWTAPGYPPTQSVLHSGSGEQEAPFPSLACFLLPSSPRLTTIIVQIL